MSEKLGIENLKEACITLINTGEKFDQALEDGKISGVEALTITVSSATGFIAIARKGKTILAEFKDLDDEERKDLIDSVSSELDLRSEYAEKKIEAGFNVAIAVGEFLGIKKEDFEVQESKYADNTEG